MKKKALILIISLIALLVLFFPIPSGALKDGGTREYTALTYKLVKWNKLISDGEIYKAWRIYPFPLNTKSVDELWQKEAANLTEENEKRVTEENTDNTVTEKKPPDTTNCKEFSDETEFSVSVKEISLTGASPYIKIEITNHSNTVFCFGETFDIFYRKINLIYGRAALRKNLHLMRYYIQFYRAEAQIRPICSGRLTFQKTDITALKHADALRAIRRRRLLNGLLSAQNFQ